MKTADVLVTNMRPGALQRLGLDYEQLAELNPRLVYCNAQGFRTDSNRAGLAAYDEIVQASSGMADLMRRATGKPTYAPTILADKLCALTIVYSVLAAVVHQRTTGRGRRVEVPMADGQRPRLARRAPDGGHVPPGRAADDPLGHAAVSAPPHARAR